MFKYKLFFTKQIDITKDILNEIIKYTTTKYFKSFKEDVLFYLNEFNTFLEMLKDKMI